jgi:hypothetical protein
MKIDSQLIGASGEHLVVSRLLYRGILASLAPRGVRKSDVLVNHNDGKGSSLIQVKTTQKGKLEWIMKPADAENRERDLFYCFVHMESSPERVYVIPARKVSQVLRDADAVWMSAPRRDGKKKAEHKMRMLKNNFAMKVKSAPHGWMDEYLEAWHLIIKKN